MNRKLAILTRISLSLSLLVLTFAIPPSTEATLSNYSDTIDDSRPSNDTGHEFLFATSLGVQTDETITLTFDDAGDAFDLATVAFGDVDIDEDDDDNACDGTWSAKTLAATATASDWGIGVNTGTDVITLTAPSSGTPITADRCVRVRIGDNATGGSGNAEINNPGSAAVYDIDIAGTFAETGTMKIVVVDILTAQVTVSETLSFTVGAVNLATCDDRPGDNVNEVATTVGTSIDFGSVTTEEFYDGCHTLTVGTNAQNGYSVTAEESDQLAFGGDTIADGVCDAACSETSEETWATSANNGFGYCIQDITGDAGTTADASMEQCDHATLPEYKNFAEHDVDGGGEAIMSSAAGLAVSDETHLGYRLTVPGTQAAGTYQNNIILVATPLY